jgi:hypothetical protein
MREIRLDKLGERLLRSGVAPRHVRRALFELKGHFADLVDELQSKGCSRAESESQAWVRLGSDDTFVASVLARPELRSWAHRWPWLAFAVLPLVTFIALFVLSMVLLAGVLTFSEHALGVMPGSSVGLHWVEAAFLSSALWIAPLVAGAIACFQAARRGAPILWPVVGTMITGLLGAMTNASFDSSPATPRGALSAGIGLSSATMFSILGRATVTIAVVLIPYLWWQRTREQITRLENRCTSAD